MKEKILDSLVSNEYDLIILDVMMPILDGVATCIEIREKYIMPIIFLSAKEKELIKFKDLLLEQMIILQSLLVQWNFLLGWRHSLEETKNLIIILLIKI